MTHPAQCLAVLPNRDDVTPVVRLLTHHIDALEKELIAARAERDQAFARGLELLLGGQDTGTPCDMVASALGEEREPIQPSEMMRVRVLSGVDKDTRVSLASLPEWEFLKGPGEGCTALREQVSPAAVPNNSWNESNDIHETFIAAARRAAQAASGGKAWPSRGACHGGPDRAGGNLANRIKQSLDERRRPILGLATIALALGTLQVGGNHFGRPPTPVAVAAPQSDVKVAAVAPLVLQPREPTALPASPIESPGPRTMAMPPEGDWQQELTAPPQPFADVAARELEAASLKKASVALDPAAVYELADRSAEGHGMARDLALAARLFEKAAAHGLVPAQYRTGKLYEKGLGVARDLGAAKTWYQRAADNGNALAMHQLAVLIAEGVGGKPDYATAIAWFRRAAQHGVRDSQFNLAVLLARGLGTTEDLAGSYTWFAIVASQGDGEAAKKRDEVGARLSAAKLSAAKLAAERWRPNTPEKFANEVQPGQGWSEAPQPKRTASAGRVQAIAH